MSSMTVSEEVHGAWCWSVEMLDCDERTDSFSSDISHARAQPRLPKEKPVGKRHLSATAEVLATGLPGDLTSLRRSDLPPLVRNHIISPHAAPIGES